MYLSSVKRFVRKTFIWRNIINKSSCEVLIAQIFPLISEIEEFRSTYIANCVLNSFLWYNVFMFNIVTICAISKASLLPKTLKTLLVNLAVSDVCVGLLAQPFYIYLLAKALRQENPSCNTFKIFDMVMACFQQRLSRVLWLWASIGSWLFSFISDIRSSILTSM